MSTSQAHSGSNEDDRRKGAMGKEVAVEDLDNKSTYNSLSSGESSGSKIDATASEEVKKLARRMAKKMAKKKAAKMAEKMAEAMCEKVMAKIMKKMEKQQTLSSSPKKSSSSKQQEYNQNSFDYSRMQNNFLLTSSRCPRQAPILDGLNYADWVNKMKMHLIALHPSLWEVANIGVRMPKSDDEVSPEMMLDLHRNAQAASVILASLSQEEFNKVNGLEVAKDIWDTLQ